MTFRPAEVGALPDGVKCPSELAGEWVVAQVRGRFERKIAGQLANIGIGYFLPMEQLRRIDSRGKRREFWRLTFPSYLFVACQHDDDRYEVKCRDGVLKIIDVKDQPRLVRELSAIAIATEHGLLANDRLKEFTPNRKCRIVRGVLEGQEAYIDCPPNGKSRVMLMVSILGRSTPTSVSVDDVELI